MARTLDQIIASLRTVEELERMLRASATTARTAPSVGLVMRISTHYDPKPIPDRRFDWSAVDRDTYEPGQPCGWGATEAEALADLAEQMEERE